jgi:AmpE protein
MKLLALIFALALEHAATRRWKLHELRWFDPYFDFALARAARAPTSAAVVIVGLFMAIVVIPWDLPYLLFAVLIVFLCLGPRNLGSEVEEYCAALDRGDHETARRVLTELSESHLGSVRSVELAEEAVFVQATNRIFGVVFWFVVFGPVGAWLFRVSDLVRRRAAFEATREPASIRTALRGAEIVQGVLAFVPARLAALGYALGGSFDDAINGWRSYAKNAASAYAFRNELIVAAVGKAAMTGYLERPANSSAAARNALRLVTRTLFIWVIVIALLTIFGWAV